MNGMVFCRGCGKEIHSTAPTCPTCGAPQAVPPTLHTYAQPLSTNENRTKSNNATQPVVGGWSWGGFLLGPIWAIGNNTWIGLLTLVPYLGIIMSIILGVKGREWAWKNKQWRNLEHFEQVQHKWTIAGVLLTCIAFVAGILVAGIIAAADS